MATTLKPETEEKLAHLAERMHRPKDEVLEDAVSRLLEYYQLLERKANPGATTGSDLILRQSRSRENRCLRR